VEILNLAKIEVNANQQPSQGANGPVPKVNGLAVLQNVAVISVLFTSRWYMSMSVASR
jgi:hypothetical protein